jgi:hypothetical protein
MQIQDGINPLLRTQLNDAVQVLKPLRLEHPRVHIVLEVSVVERDAETVQAEGFVELGVGFGEEVVQPFVEEEVLGALVGLMRERGEGDADVFLAP